jgi:hypothetical protein
LRDEDPALMARMSWSGTNAPAVRVADQVLRHKVYAGHSQNSTVADVKVCQSCRALLSGAALRVHLRFIKPMNGF